MGTGMLQSPGRTRSTGGRGAAARTSAISGPALARTLRTGIASALGHGPERATIPGRDPDRRRPLHPRPLRLGAAVAPVADGGELGRLPAGPPRAGHAPARRRLRARDADRRPGPPGRAGR